MILSTHYAVGMAIASQTDYWLLMPIASLISHFVLDRIPHWEYLDSSKQIKNNIPIIALDLLFPATVSLMLFANGILDFKELFWLNLGGFFGILPDGLVFLKIVTRSKNAWLKGFFKFHRKNHTLKNLKPFWGALSQAIIIVTCLGLISIAKNIGIG